MTDTSDIDRLIEDCWQRGQTTQETREIVNRRLGRDPGFDWVRRIFVDLSHTASPTGDHP